MALLLAMLMAVNFLGNGFLSRLPIGDETPTVSASCKGSGSELGTMSIGGADKEHSIVNIWAINRKGWNGYVGWIVKTYGGRYYYEGLIGGDYIDVSEGYGILDGPYISFVGCFRDDLPGSLLGNAPKGP